MDAGGERAGFVCLVEIHTGGAGDYGGRGKMIFCAGGAELGLGSKEFYRTSCRFWRRKLTRAIAYHTLSDG